ncbi:cell division protein FtsH, partial [bacterium]
MVRSNKRSWLVWTVILAGALILGFAYQSAQSDQRMTLTELASAIRAGKVAAVQVSGDESRALVTLTDDTQRTVLKERSSDTFFEQLGLGPDDLGDVKYSVARASSLGGLAPLLGALVPFVLMVGLLVFMMRQAQSGNNQAMAFGRSRARLMTGDTPTVTFNDVAGIDEAKQELAEVVEFLREPEKFIALGARIPKGVLMVGPPG